MTTDLKLLRLPQVLQRVATSRASLYAKVQRGEFPKPISLGGRAVAWPQHEVDAWIEARIAHRDSDQTCTKQL
jgi:prophage regulatory protein